MLRRRSGRLRRRWYATAPGTYKLRQPRLEPPRQIRVLAIEEEVRVEVTRRDPRALERGAPVEAGGAGRAEDRLLRLEAPRGFLSRTAIEVASRGGGRDPGRIEAVRRGETRSRRAEEPPRGGADVRRVGSVEAARQDAGEVVFEPAIGIECQNVAARGRVDPDVHRGGEAHVLGKGQDPYGRAEP